MSHRLGIDTGGTFTDFVRLDDDGLSVHKVRSTPDDPSAAILAGIEALAGTTTGLDVVHGSTVATNAVLERKGARVALVTTQASRTCCASAVRRGAELYNIRVAIPRPIVAPELTFGVLERLDADGRPLVPVDLASVDAVAAACRAHDAEIVAVCLLHAYANPDHERQVAERLAHAGLTVSISHEVLPEYREYERWSTTVVNAYVTPIIDRYLGRLETRLAGSRLPSCSRTAARSRPRPRAPRRSERCSPAPPPASSARAPSRARPASVASSRFDMGGTSTDVSLLDDGIPTSTESKVGDFPVRLPVIDIHTVGAGGGSIAFVDSGGALRVGPRSAGASPGPACYGVGTEMTVTDANLLLGRLDPERFLGGRMTLDVDRAQPTSRQRWPPG